MLDFIRAVLLLLLRLRLLRLHLRLLRLLTRRLLLAVQIPVGTAVGTAGHQPRLPGRSGHCRTSTATSRLQWALPDLNRDFQIAVGTAGPQREECEKRCQIECQKICQIECQTECQKICQPDRMPEDLPDRMPEDMPDRMPEDLPVRECINVMVGITRSKVIGVLPPIKHRLGFI